MSNRHRNTRDPRKPREAHEREAGGTRDRRSIWLKIGVWIFLAIFVFSVAGGVVLIGGLGNR